MMAGHYRRPVKKKLRRCPEICLKLLSIFRFAAGPAKEKNRPRAGFAVNFQRKRCARALQLRLAGPVKARADATLVNGPLSTRAKSQMLRQRFARAPFV
jgi:hypothetical protein